MRCVAPLSAMMRPVDASSTPPPRHTRSALGVVLRDRRPDDLPLLAHWLTDAGAEWRRWDAPYFPAPVTNRTMETYVAHMAAHPPDADEQVIDVDGVCVGMVNRSQEEPEGGGWWDLGILILDPAYWGGGWAHRRWPCGWPTPSTGLTPTC